MDDKTQGFPFLYKKRERERDLDGGTYSKNLKFHTATSFKRSIIQHFESDS